MCRSKSSLLPMTGKRSVARRRSSQWRLFTFFGNYLAKKVEERNTFLYVSPLHLVNGLHPDPTVEVTIDGDGDIQERRRPGASFHDDPDGAGLFSALGAVAVPHSPAFTVTASRLRQVGYRSYLTGNGLLLNDEALVNEAEHDRYVARLSQGTPFENEDTGLAPNGLLHSVTVAHARLIKPAEFRAIDGEYRLN